MPRPEVTQQHGYVHAGILSTMADTAGGFAGFTLFPADSSVLTVEFKLNLLSATGILPSDPVRRVTSGYDALTTFTEAARDRGIMTRQEVTLDSNTSFGIQAGGKVGPVALGGSFENSTQTITSGDAYYFDGKRWQPWAECAA